MTLRGRLRLIEILPTLAKEIEELLNKQNESKLADQVVSLAIVDRCRCGEDFCGAFYVEPSQRELTVRGIAM
jgi:hypothetical protein